MPDHAGVCTDAWVRLTPEQSPSPFFSLRQSPASGWGVYATQDLARGTRLFESANLAVSVVYRTFRKEACAWCFCYDDGRHWRVHVGRNTSTGGDQKLGVVVFCSDECKDSWMGFVGDIGLAAYGAVEDFVCRRSRKSNWSSSETDSPHDSEVPSNEQIEEVS